MTLRAGWQGPKEKKETKKEERKDSNKNIKYM